MSLLKVIEETTVEVIRKAEGRLPIDVKEALRSASEKETSRIGKGQLKTILENVELAEDLGRPICQDTGLITFYVSIGDKFGIPVGVDKILISAVEKATSQIPLRPSIVHPLSRRNTGTNVGAEIPSIRWKFASGDFLEITALVRGAGCENVSSLVMLNPTEGIEGLRNSMLKLIYERGPYSCPPLTVGVGLGGTAKQALELAERALLRPLGEKNRDKKLADLEDDLLQRINATGIGPMGLGGETTALAVKIECAHTHTACLPVGISVSCWCLRKASARIHSDGTSVILRG